MFPFTQMGESELDVSACCMTVGVEFDRAILRYVGVRELLTVDVSFTGFVLVPFEWRMSSN